jgi:hypothetical protein
VNYFFGNIGEQEMNQQRKEIILKEIEYWKKNRLLPEQYCNYLLTLYSEGEHQTSKDKTRFTFRLITILSVLFIFLLPAALLVNYFTEMSFGLQTTINFILLAISITFTMFYNKKNPVCHIVFMVLAFLIFFVATIEVADNFFPTNIFILGGIIVFHCLLWFLFGKRFQLTYLKISGLIGFVLVVGYIFTQAILI